MPWQVIYRTSDGEALQITTSLPAQLPPGLTSKSVGASRPTGNWSPVTLTFEPPVQQEISTAEFMDRINAENPAAWAEIMAARQSDPQVAAIVQRLNVDVRIDLTSTLAASSLAYLVTVTSLTQEQVDSILTPQPA